MKIAIAYVSIRRETDGKFYHSSFPIDLDLVPEDPEELDKFFIKGLIKYLTEVKDVLPKRSEWQDFKRESWSVYEIDEAEVEYLKMLGEEQDVTFKIEKVFNNAFDKIILPDQYREKIIEVVNQLRDKDKIFNTWGLGEKIGSRGRGVNILLSGESGTGKTFCGEIIAEYLGFEVELVSVATLESKWVGESEKNVSQIFQSISNKQKVLILDEVDSFLTSRNKQDQHYESKLVNQFLIELERHHGICVMTTNRPVHLDRALSRRIDLVLNFPKPTSEVRGKIWKQLIPEKMPQNKINISTLAAIDINGGLIKNAILSSARFMITNNVEKLTTDILVHKALEERSEQEILLTGDYS